MKRVHPSLSAVNWFQKNRTLCETALSYTERYAFRNYNQQQEYYSETALSEARCSEEYLYFIITK
jgi:hypothetical protein